MNQRALVLFTLFLSSSFFFVSCNKDSEPVYEADVDIFVMKKLVDGVTKYAPMYYVYGAAAIESVTVTPPEGELADVELEKSENYTTIFLSDTSESDYTQDMPTEGTYEFNITFKDGPTLTATDYFYSDELDIPAISECYWDSDYSAIYLSWEPVTNAYAYNVSFWDADKNIIFSSTACNDETTQVRISTSTNVWYNSPASNMSITVELNAYLFDSDATEDEWTYNIQCNSSSEFETVWNPATN